MAEWLSFFVQAFMVGIRHDFWAWQLECTFHLSLLAYLSRKYKRRAQALLFFSLSLFLKSAPDICEGILFVAG
jgi:hypothetical protein